MMIHWLCGENECFDMIAMVATRRICSVCMIAMVVTSHICSICGDKKIGDKKFYEGDVKALRDFGFDSYKLDGEYLLI